MRRLAAAGMLHFTRESQELYRSPALPLETRAREPDEARSAQAILDADRALRMAKTLADGGFPEEAPALLAKSLRAMTTALMAARGEAPASAESDVDADIRRLVECGALPRRSCPFWMRRSRSRAPRPRKTSRRSYPRQREF